jgi:uncharacterized SAM-binding protein YcdF (DUF218 family)
VALLAAGAASGALPAHPRGVASADAALVLGFALDSAGRPRPPLLGRVAHAAELYRQGHVQRLVVSGGVPRGGHTEAQVMRELLRAAGVPDSRIILEGRSRTTLENFACSRPILERIRARKVLLVTDGSHMPRALLLAHRHGLWPTPSAVPVQPGTRLTGLTGRLEARDSVAYLLELIRNPFAGPARCP